MRSIEKCRQVIDRIGKKGLLEAILYPVLVPVYVLCAWPFSIWTSRTLLSGRWGRYQGFNPLNALNSFFYKTQWLNLEKYGRKGISRTVGLGEYPLYRWFHLTLLSSCLYANAGAVTTLLGTLVWLFSHLIWLDYVSCSWGLTVCGVLLISSTTYSMAFVRQNYNILGWMLLPMAIYAVISGQWVFAGIVFLLASLASITVIFTALPLILVYSVTTSHWEALASLVPATIKVASHLLPMFFVGGIKTPLLNIAKLIGFISVGVRYHRASMRFGIVNIYFFTIYSLACGMLWLGNADVPLLSLTALALFIINQRFARFADDQSIIMLFVTVYCAELLSAPPSWIGIAGLVLAANPLPVVVRLSSVKRDGTLVKIPSFKPFDHESLMSALSQFFSHTPNNSRVYFAFDDPDGDYERLFDGYRRLLELPLYIASDRGIHMFPDWYAVAETNYQGAPNCWGRSPKTVIENVKLWKANYIIVYQDTGTSLEEKWFDLGFIEKSSFDWGLWIDELQGDILWDTEQPPKWWLLEVPPTD